MQWLTNTYDPRDEKAKVVLYRRLRETREQAWTRHLANFKDTFIGPPRATEDYSQTELVTIGIVGIYAGKPGEKCNLGFWSFDTYMHLLIAPERSNQ